MRQACEDIQIFKVRTFYDSPRHPPATPPPHAPRASSVLQPAPPPICPCISASAVAARGQLWGPPCDYSHMAAPPPPHPVLWPANRGGRKEMP